MAHAVGLDVLADMMVDAGGQRQVEEGVGLRSPRQGGQVGVETGEGAPIIIPA